MLLASDTFSYPVFLRKGGMKWSYLSVSAHIVAFNPKDNFNHVSGRRRYLKAMKTCGWMEGREAAEHIQQRMEGTHRKHGQHSSLLLAHLCKEMQEETQETTNPAL